VADKKYYVKSSQNSKELRVLALFRMESKAPVGFRSFPHLRGGRAVYGCFYRGSADSAYHGFWMVSGQQAALAAALFAWGTVPALIALFFGAYRRMKNGERRGLVASHRPFFRASGMQP
jgi:hypothetical protein